MDNEKQTPVRANQGVSFLEQAKFLQEHIKILLTLATGSLVLSVGLLHDLGQTIHGKQFLHSSWLWLFASVIAGVACNYALTVHLTSKTDRYGALVKLVSFVLHACFAVAMAYFVRFALANLSAT
jgi:hypothetical protein